MVNKRNGKIIKKLPMLKANSVLRAKKKRMQIKSYGNLNKRNSNPLSFVLSKKGNNRKKYQYSRKTKFQFKLVKWSNANSRRHLRKINEKIRRKLGRHTSHSLMQLPRNHYCSRSHLRTKSIIKYTKKNIAIAPAATFAQSHLHDTLKIFKHLLPYSHLLTEFITKCTKKT